jgi:recombination protein RecT
VSAKEEATKAIAKRNQAGSAGALERWYAQPGNQKKMEALSTSTMGPERMMSIAMMVVKGNRDLMGCSAPSIVSAVMEAGRLGLEVGGALGEAYLVPRKTKGVYHAQFQLGYKGKIKLAAQNGVAIDFGVVREGDEFLAEKGTATRLVHKQSLAPGRELQPPLAYYAIAHQPDLIPVFELMTPTEVEAHRDRFVPYWKSSPWATDFDSMAVKTVIHRLAKRVPLAVKLQEAIGREDGVESGAAPVVAHSELLDEADLPEPGERGE